MCETLPKGTITTVPEEHDCTEEHLDPSQHWIRLSDYTVYAHSQGAQCPLVYVQLEVHAQRELRRNRYEEDIGKLGVRARKKLSAAMRMSKYVAS